MAEVCKLQNWAENIRESYKNGMLDPDLEKDLDDLGFIFDERLSRLRSVFKDDGDIVVIKENGLI